MIVHRVLTLFYSFYPCFSHKGTPAARGAPWPLPQVWENSTVVHTINPHDFQFLSSHSHYDVITEAFSRYKDILINVSIAKQCFLTIS